MTVNSANARIFGSDTDAIYLAPIGTTLPTTIDGALDDAFEDVGWLHSDGIKETPTGSKTDVRGHQGQRVVRTRMDTPGTTIGFHALESKAQTKQLRYDESDVTTTAGVRKATRSPGQKVSARAAVVDIFDADDVTVKERWVFPRIEITPDGERVFANSDIAGFPFMAEVTSDYTVFESAASGDVATVTNWTVSVAGAPTGGTYTLSVNTFTTAPIAYGANASTVAAAINALSGVTGLGTVTASGTIDLVFPTAVFLTADGSNLTGGTDPDVTVAATA